MPHHVQNHEIQALSTPRGPLPSKPILRVSAGLSNNVLRNGDKAQSKGSGTLMTMLYKVTTKHGTLVSDCSLSHFQEAIKLHSGLYHVCSIVV